MERKIIHGLPQTADRQDAVQTGIENELKRRLQLSFGEEGGIVSMAGDVNVNTAPCALARNGLSPTLVDVLPGTVVFPSGEYVDVSTLDIQGVSLPTSSDSYVFRLVYGEVADGPVTANPYYNTAAQPSIRKKTPSEMLVVETVAAYQSQPADVQAASVVLGVAAIQSGQATVDNARDTYTFSRPWASVTDVAHRLQVGTGMVTATNPHGTSANDLTLGAYTTWQALVGRPSAVIARPLVVGRVPGIVCEETIPAGNFATDATGAITGTAGAFYVILGKWPERLLTAKLPSPSTTMVAAWLVQGTQTLAVYDPVAFAVAADLYVEYAFVQAAALPNSVNGLTELTLQQPTADELLVAGGVGLTELTEPKVLFSDVGVIPMTFDIRVDAQGTAYKSPRCVYCNTLLDTMGATAQPVEIEMAQPSYLRLAITGYNPGFTSVTFQLVGLDEDDNNISMPVTFTGPLAASGVSPTEVTWQRVFPNQLFSSLTSVQVVSRVGDGPNTALAIFCEDRPTRKNGQDDALVARVHWNGSNLTVPTATNPRPALDMRHITTGGGLRSSLAALDLDAGFPNPGGLFSSPSPARVTLVEDFDDPQWSQISASQPGNVDADNHGVGGVGGTYPSLNVYRSRRIYLGRLFDATTLGAGLVNLRLLPRSHRLFPRSVTFSVAVTLYFTGGSQTATFAGTVTGTPPFAPVWTPPWAPVYAGQVYAVSVNVDMTGSFTDVALLQGWAFHIASA